MARVDSLREDHATPPDVTGKCSVCGETSTGYWHGERVVEVCRVCAVEVLPKLIADAVLANHHRPDMTPFAQYMATAEKNYWYAATCALASAAKDKIESLQQQVNYLQQSEDVPY